MMAHEIQHPENEGKVAVFDTEAEALAAQENCLANHLANHNDNPAYSAKTTAWANPRQRTDGKWTIPVCHHTDASGAPNLVAYDAADYPEENPE